MVTVQPEAQCGACLSQFRCELNGALSCWEINNHAIESSPPLTWWADLVQSAGEYQPGKQVIRCARSQVIEHEKAHACFVGYRCDIESGCVVAGSIRHDLGELVLTVAAKRLHENPPGVFALGLVDKDIGICGVCDHVWPADRIPREDDRPALIVEPIAHRRVDWLMVNLKGCNFQTAIVKQNRVCHVRCPLRCACQSEGMRNEWRFSCGETMQC